MTANVTFIYDHRDSALRVANAALRFQPPAELAKAACGGGAGGARRRRRRRRQRRAAGGAAADEGGGGEPRRAARAARRRTGGRSGLLRGPTPTPVRVRAGVSDGTNTEIETPELHEGDRVVTDAEIAGRRQQAARGAARSGGCSR